MFDTIAKGFRQARNRLAGLTARFESLAATREGQELASRMGYLPADPSVAPPAGFPDPRGIRVMPFDPTVDVPETPCVLVLGRDFAAARAFAARLVVAAQAGLDIATSGPWSINLDAKKIFFSSDAVDRKSGIKTKVHLDPWVLSAGFGYRF